MYNSIYKNNHNKCLLISIEKNMYERKKKVYFVELSVYCISYRLILKYWLAKSYVKKIIDVLRYNSFLK